MATIYDPIHPELLKACQRAVARNSDNKKKLKTAVVEDEEFSPSKIFPDDLDEEQDESEDILAFLTSLPSRDKIKKPKKVLTEEELAEKERKKAEYKAQKEAIKKAHAEAKALKKKQKEEREREEQKQRAEIASIELMARKEYLLNKLETMDFRKKKSASKIADINIELKSIDFELNRIRTEFGIDIKEINNGSKVKRFFRKVKSKFHRFGKKTKKFVKNNSELIFGLASVFLPIIGTVIYKAVM